MNIGRMFASAIVRRVAYVVVALAFAWLGMDDARAVNPGPITYQSCESFSNSCTFPQAMSACQQWVTVFLPNQGYACRVGPPSPNHIGAFSPTGTNAVYKLVGDGCPAGKTWDWETSACVDPRERCLAKNEDTPKSSSAIYTGQKCFDGCQYGARPGKTGSTVAGSAVIAWGELGFTGDTCPVNDGPEPPPKKDEECTQPSGLLTVCVKKNGDHCYTATTGRRICWTPGETGTKTDGGIAQKRGPGGDKPPAPTPPPGETLNDSNKPTPTTTTTPGGTVINTTTNNWSTGNGTNAGDNDDGETPGQTPGDGEEGDQGSASGGDGCDAPPVCSGDNIGCASLLQIWRVRCSPDKNKVEGGGECDANGNPLLVCTGDQVACKAMLLQAEQHCLAKKGDANGDGQPDWTVPGEGDGTEGAGDDPGEDVGKVQTASFGAPMLDESGLSWSRSCPDLGTLQFGPFGAFDLNSVPWICDFTTMVRGVFFLLGSFLALMIVMGWKGF